MTNQAHPLVSVVVPAYNEIENLPELYRQLEQVFGSMDAELEFLVVDDSSTDETLTWLKELSSNDPRVQFVSFSRNFGHQAAVSAGLQHASGDVVVVMDADLQDPPEVIPQMMERWYEGFQVVVAKRIERTVDPMKKRFFAWAYYRMLTRLATVKIPVDGGDFCLMDRVVIDTLNRLPERNRYVRGLRAWAGFKQTEQPFRRQERLYGKPKYSFLKSLALALDGLVSFSPSPLRFATHVGLATAVLSIAMACLVVYWRFFTNAPLAGYATIITAFLFLGSIQLLTIGILGEYIARIYDEVKNRPNYVINEARTRAAYHHTVTPPMPLYEHSHTAQGVSVCQDHVEPVSTYARVGSVR